MSAPYNAKPDPIARLQQLPMRHQWLRWAVLAASLVFSGASTYYFSTQVRQEARSRFETVAIGVANDVQSRIRAYGDVLFALRGLFDSSDKVTRDEFHQFAQALSLGERYPGVTNISFAARVPHAKKLQFERAVRAETSPLIKGLPEFAIKPPGERPEYAVLTYIEPMGKNVPAWGLDLNADPLRRSVTDRARDTGRMASSSGVTLLRDGNSSVSSTLLRLALYRGGGVPGSVEERQRLYWGMVGSTVRVSEMIDATLSKEVLSRAQLQIYEVGNAPGAGAAGDTLLLDSAASGSATSTAAPAEFSGYMVNHRLAVGDREWRLRIVPRKDPVALLDKVGVAAISAAALAVSALLFWLMTSIAVSESRGAELAKRNREAALLRTLSENLQSCVSLGESYEVIAKRVPMLLPETAGTVFLLDASRTRNEAVAKWGAPSAGVEDAFSPEDCHAVRRGQLRYVPDSASEPNCRHFSGAPPACYVCVPLTAQNEVIGMMHVQRSGAPEQRWLCTDEALFLINGASEYVGLAVANLALREKLREQALHDKLTGLYNRHYVQEWFNLELRRAQRHGRPIAAILLDIDHFKRFNDSFGHDAGDLVLRELAGVLRRLARQSDVASRYGGEEFLVLLPECPFDAALRKAEQLREEVAKLKLEYDNKTLGVVTVSLGVAAFPDHAQEARALLRCADEALYEAKAAGRNRVVGYSGEREKTQARERV
jgi:diguanylate cyclase (GGDEF)-like protein